VTGFDGGPLVVPDFAAAIEAWRVWRVVDRKDGGYCLASMVKTALWTPGEPLIARCLRGSALAGWLRHKRSGGHEAPMPRCECGVYAAWLPMLSEYLRLPPPSPTVAVVVGQVSLWGTVIECERGFRASFAYPLRLYLPRGSAGGDRPRERLLSELRTYRVPVESLPARAEEVVEVLAERQLASF
jgi:hypothetical protein